MKTSCVDDVDFIRARRDEITGERLPQRETDAPAAGRMPKDDWPTLKAQSQRRADARQQVAAGITEDLGVTMAPIGARHEAFCQRGVPARVLP